MEEIKSLMAGATITVLYGATTSTSGAEIVVVSPGKAGQAQAEWDIRHLPAACCCCCWQQSQRQEDMPHCEPPGWALMLPATAVSGISREQMTTAQLSRRWPRILFIMIRQYAVTYC